MQVYPNQFSSEIGKGLASCYLVFGDEPQQKFEVIEQIRRLADDALVVRLDSLDHDLCGLLANLRSC